eukprot:11292962-Alexandrium_andersonii.AAC.1
MTSSTESLTKEDVAYSKMSCIMDIPGPHQFWPIAMVAHRETHTRGNCDRESLDLFKPSEQVRK